MGRRRNPQSPEGRLIIAEVFGGKSAVSGRVTIRNGNTRESINVTWRIRE